MIKQFCAGSFCTRSITDTRSSSSFIALLVWVKNTDLLLTLTQTHPEAHSVQLLTSPGSGGMTSPLSSAPASWEGRRGRAETGRRRGRQRGNLTGKVSRIWRPLLHRRCACRSCGLWDTARVRNKQLWEQSPAIIPLMHALKTGQVQEINSAEVYYLHMTKNAWLEGRTEPRDPALASRMTTGLYGETWCLETCCQAAEKLSTLYEDCVHLSFLLLPNIFGCVAVWAGRIRALICRFGLINQPFLFSFTVVGGLQRKPLEPRKPENGLKSGKLQQLSVSGD